MIIGFKALVVVKDCLVVEVLIAFKLEYLFPIGIGFVLFVICLNSPWSKPSSAPKFLILKSSDVVTIILGIISIFMNMYYTFFMCSYNP